MDDDSLGPRLSGSFDFTLKFERIVFHIVPSAVVLLAIPYYLYKAITSRPAVRPGVLLWMKLATAAAIAGVQLAAVVYWYTPPSTSKLAQAASFLSLLGSMGIVFLTYSSHTHYLQPLVFLALFLSVTLLFDLVTIYSYFRRAGLGSIARITCALPGLKLALLILEELSKRSLVIDPAQRSTSSEVVAGFWSRSTFLWINPLLLFGFRNRIRNDHLPDIGPQFDSERQYRAFKRQWDKQDKNSRYALLKACVLADPWPYVYIILPRLLLIGFIYSQPFLLQDVVDFISGGLSEEEKAFRENEKISLILATALIFLGKAICRNCYGHIENQLRISLRGFLVAAVYNKSLALPATEAEELAAVTLVTADISGAEDFLSIFYNSCGAILEIGCGMAVLSHFVGLASIFTVITATAIFFASNMMASRMVLTQKRWNEHIEDRVSTTSNMLAQMRDVKMLGLAPSMGKHLEALHDKETEVSLENRTVVSATFGISAITESVTPAIVLAATLFWTRASEEIGTARFYSIIAIVTITIDPVSSIFLQLSSWSGGFACLNRIQAYLVQPEAKDPRRFNHFHQVTVASSSTGSNLRSRHTRSSQMPFSVRIQNAIVAYGENVDAVLRNVTALLKPSEITMLYGSVGCGKTTFLKTILGEVVLKNGSVTLATTSMAYAAQHPWLLNISIRLNIIGNKVYNQNLYQRIVFICALDIDFRQLPDGDQTLAGSGGANLSGGQKQRIAMARALYIEAEVTLLDDPFSSLDKQTSTLVRTRLLSDSFATAEGKSLVITTSMRQHLVDANSIFRITDDGHIEEVPLDVALDGAATAASEDADTQQLEALPIVSPPSSKDTDEEEQLDPAHGGISLYSFYMGPAGIIMALTWLVLVSLAALAERLPNIFVRIWLGKDAQDYRYFIGYVLLCLAYPLANVLSTWFYFRFISAKNSSGLHTRLTDSVFGATFEFLMQEDASAILNRFSQDLAMGSQHVPMWMMPAVFRSVSVLIDVAIISAGAKFAATVIPLFVINAIVIQQFYLRTSRQLRALQLDSSKNLVRQLTETANGVEHIRAFGWIESSMQQFYMILDIAQRPGYFFFCIQQWLEGVLDLSTTVTAVGVVSLALVFPGTASANSMGLAFLSLINFSDTVAASIRSSVRLETSIGGVQRLRSFVAKTPEEYTGGHDVDARWPISGRVEFQNVSARYVSREGRTTTPVYDINATIEPGETLGIVGRTGSGKSTVMLTILNLLRYTGRITIDHLEIRDLKSTDLRSRITTITQSGLHLRGSVRFNLNPFDPAHRPPNYLMTDAMQEFALRRVGLWDLIFTRGDLDTTMKDMRFSHGQKQLFQMARAILHRQATNSRIVLMDEATSSLDEDTEGRINTLLREEFDGCTKIIISHRQAVLDAAHAVMTLSDGRATVERNPDAPEASNSMHGN